MNKLLRELNHVGVETIKLIPKLSTCTVPSSLKQDLNALELNAFKIPSKVTINSFIFNILEVINKIYIDSIKSILFSNG